MILGIIPARYASTRFPGKPLIDIQGKSMLQRVYEQAVKSRLLAAVVIATDDERIREHAAGFGATVVMTGTDHASGTDRCYDAALKAGGSYRYVINIQGDEPFLDPEQIDSLAAVLEDEQTEIATQVIPVSSAELLHDPGEVKVVINIAGEGLYFSRSVIPYLKNVPPEEWHLHHPYYRHVGLYAYRMDVLAQLSALPVSTLEKAESLEQLRWLQAGYRIRCVPTTFESHCIDTPEDVEKVLRLMHRS